MGWERDRGRQEGADDVHLRHFTLHVLRSLRRRMSDALSGTDAGIRTEPVRPQGHEMGPAETGRRQSAGGVHEIRTECLTSSILFYIFGAIAVVSAILVITQKNVVHSAAFLAATLLSVAGIFLTLHAEFLAGVQVIVYVGGILVLFVFVIMLISRRAVRARAAVQPAVDDCADRRRGILIAEFGYGLYRGQGFLSCFRLRLRRPPAATLTGILRAGRHGAVHQLICCHLRSRRSCCWLRLSAQSFWQKERRRSE